MCLGRFTSSCSHLPARVSSRGRFVSMHKRANSIPEATKCGSIMHPKQAQATALPGHASPGEQVQHLRHVAPAQDRRQLLISHYGSEKSGPRVKLWTRHLIELQPSTSCQASYGETDPAQCCYVHPLRLVVNGDGEGLHLAPLDEAAAWRGCRLCSI